MRKVFGDTDFCHHRNNPFSLFTNKETLFNIGTGKAASKDAFHLFFMPLVLETGLVKNLQKDLKATQKKLEERIKKQKIHSFAKEGTSFNLNNENKIMEVKMKHDLFGSILSLALNGKLIWVKRFGTIFSLSDSH